MTDKIREAFEKAKHEWEAHDDWRFADREACWKFFTEAGYQACAIASQERITELEQAIEQWKAGREAQAELIAKYAAELEAAKKDAERLDYVLRKQLIVVQDCDDEYFTYNSSSGKIGPVANSAIFAIDQAIKEKP